MRFFNLRKGIIAACSFLLLGSIASALVVPGAFAPRQAPYQSTSHFRKTVNYNDGNIAAGIKIGAMPAGAYIVSVRCYVSTTFNAGTTNSLKIGSTQAGSDYLAGGVTAGTNCVLGTGGNQNMTSAPGLGLAVTGAATPTGSTGGWDIWVQYAQTGTAATQGQVTFLIDYIANDDQ